MDESCSVAAGFCRQLPAIPVNSSQGQGEKFGFVSHLSQGPSGILISISAVPLASLLNSFERNLLSLGGGSPCGRCSRACLGGV